MSLVSSPSQFQSRMSGDPNTNYGYSGTTGELSPFGGGDSSLMSPVAKLHAMMNSPIFQALTALTKNSNPAIPTMGDTTSSSIGMGDSATPRIVGSPFSTGKSSGSRLF